jgi:hypothetical protein
MPATIGRNVTEAAAPPNAAADESDPGAELKQLISRQAEAVAQRSMWSRQLEEQWASVIGACMNLGYLGQADPIITARLILGMICAAAQQRQPAEQISAQQITRAVVALLHLESDGG